jgi:hypothetical protein
MTRELWGSKLGLQANLQQLDVDSQCAQGADFAKGYNQILQADGSVTLWEYSGTVHAQAVANAAAAHHH